MWGAVPCLVVGASSIVAAVFGKRFYAGLSSRGQIPAWQGRAWLGSIGILLALTGVAGLLADSHPGLSAFLDHFVDQGFWTLDVVYRLFGGSLALFVGAAFLFAGRNKTDRTGKLLGAAAVLFGVALISSALWKMTR